MVAKKKKATVTRSIAAAEKNFTPNSNIVFSLFYWQKMMPEKTFFLGTPLYYRGYFSIIIVIRSEALDLLSDGVALGIFGTYLKSLFILV
jgi:hypothetical protein